ncbi:hypothetical protein BDV93DRAFT_529344 [Ceratobasidium sp. AG-I]|nr:hypothetical protein BDV93DRAFT_529344 [Ceratobasidium sp. AG-I]
MSSATSLRFVRLTCARLNRCSLALGYIQHLTAAVAQLGFCLLLLEFGSSARSPSTSFS